MTRRPNGEEVRAYLETLMSSHSTIVDRSQNEDVSTLTLPDSDYYYHMLIDCGWLNVETDVGFKKIVYMPQIPRKMIGFARSLTRDQSSIDRACIIAKNFIADAVKPGQGIYLRYAKEEIDSFVSNLSAWVGSLRETRSEMMGGKDLSVYFEEFLTENLFKNFENLSLQGNPKLHTPELLNSLYNIRYNENLSNKLQKITDLKMRVISLKSSSLTFMR